MIEMQRKVLPIEIPDGMKPLDAIKQYKCQIMTCWKRARSTFDFENEVRMYMVCMDHLLLIGEGDSLTHIFLSDVMWLYSQFLDFVRVLHV